MAQVHTLPVPRTWRRRHGIAARAWVALARRAEERRIVRDWLRRHPPEMGRDTGCRV